MRKVFVRGAGYIEQPCGCCVDPWHDTERVELTQEEIKAIEYAIPTGYTYSIEKLPRVCSQIDMTHVTFFMVDEDE